MSDGGRSELHGWVHVCFCLMTLARRTLSAGESAGDGSGEPPTSVAAEMGSLSSIAISKTKLERCWLGVECSGGRVPPPFEGLGGRDELNRLALVEPRIMARSAFGNDC